MARIIDIADAIVAELASGVFSMEFTPRRRVLPESDLEDLKTLTVTVVPKALDLNLQSRSMTRRQVQVDIGIQKRVGVDIDADVAALMELVEEIATFMDRRNLPTAMFAHWLGTENDPIYSPAHLAETRTFTSVLTLTYWVVE